MADVSLARRDRAGEAAGILLARCGGGKNDISWVIMYLSVCVCLGCAENLFTLLSLYPVRGTCVGAAGVPKRKKSTQKNTKL